MLFIRWIKSLALYQHARCHFYSFCSGCYFTWKLFVGTQTSALSCGFSVQVVWQAFHMFSQENLIWKRETFMEIWGPFLCAFPFCLKCRGGGRVSFLNIKRTHLCINVVLKHLLMNNSCFLCCLLNTGSKNHWYEGYIAWKSFPTVTHIFYTKSILQYTKVLYFVI